MKTINLTFTGEQEAPNEYFKPFVCKPDSELPQQYNKGWNSFRFIGGEPKFVSGNAPEILRIDGENYLHYECAIVVVNPSGRRVSGTYTKSVNKQTNTTESERFTFD